MKKLIPRFSIWISFILFCLFGLAIIFSMLINFLDLTTNFLFVVGQTLGSILILYFLVYIPSRILYETKLKKEKSN